MPHESLADPDEHSTVVASDAHGQRVSTGHVTTDAARQQVGSAILYIFRENSQLTSFSCRVHRTGS